MTLAHLNMRPSTANYFAPLTGLRAIAAGLVVFFHYWEAGRALHGSSLPIITWLMGNGQAGVTIFFVLSGFLITIRYHQEFLEGRASFRLYWLKRFIRIYPIYFFVVTFLVIVPESLTGNLAYQNGWVLIGLYGLAQGFLLPLFSLGIPVGWTLTLEELYYLIAPRLSAWLDRNRIGTATNPSFFTPIIRGLLLSAGLALIFFVVLELPILTHFTGYNTEFLYSVSLLIRLPEFIAGAVAGLLFLNHRAIIQPHASKLTSIGLIVGVITLQAANHFFLEDNFSVYAAFRFLGALCVANLMLGIGCGGSNGVTRRLGSPAMEYLGKTSYALYLVHLAWPMQRLYDVLLQLPIHPVAIAPLMYAAGVILSIVLYELIERPVHQWLSAKLDQRPKKDAGLQRNG